MVHQLAHHLGFVNTSRTHPVPWIQGSNQDGFMLQKKDGFLGSQHKAQFFIIFNDAESAKKITRPHRRGVLPF